MTAVHLKETDLAERWQIPVKTIREWRRTGRGPRFRKFGQAVRYPLTEVEAFEEAQTRRSTSDPGAAA